MKIGATIQPPILGLSDKSNVFGQKSCRTKVSRIFRVFVPNFAPNFAQNFPRFFWGFFVLCFVGNGDQEKIHQKNPPFFNAKLPGKHEKNIHKMFLESRQSNNVRSSAMRSWECHGNASPDKGKAENPAGSAESIAKGKRKGVVLIILVSGYSAIGDTISCDAPYSAIVRRPQDRRYLGGSASLFGITWKVSVAIFGQGFWSSVE